MTATDLNAREEALEKKTEFEQELLNASDSISTVGTVILLIEAQVKRKEIINIMRNLRDGLYFLNKIHDSLLRYNDFLEILDKKFGTNSMKHNKSSMKTIGDMKKEIGQMLTLVSHGKLKVAEEIFKSFASNFRSLKKNLAVICKLPYIIDYSKLSNRDWRMIGVAGIHYRSKVFLSYHFRDPDPKKDENQQLIDYYVEPTLELLNIESVTARGYLKPQELVDDRIIELIEDCDGIIGFYTRNDSVENVEHELSKNPNVIAICKEEGARVPSMRLSRLLIDFKRDQMGDFSLQLIRALKDKGLFRLMI